MIKTLGLLIILWFVLNSVYVVIVRNLGQYQGKVVTAKFNPFLETFVLFGLQFAFLKLLIHWVINRFQKEQLQERKSVVLQNVVNDLNTNLVEEKSLTITRPSTTRGVDVWVYLANNLSENEKSSLEDYFIGILSKYTTEFALDILIIELNAGAGWVAKFDVKPIAEATYNRMARASEVETKEEFEDIDIW